MAGDIIHLIGFPGIGKLTIAKEMIRNGTDCVLVDNHLINNPIFSVIRADGKTPLPNETWAKISQIRDIVLSAMETLSLPQVNFIMTNVILNDDIDRAECAKIEAVAVRRGGRYIPVLLACEIEENRRRIVSPERRTNLKCIDPGEPDNMLAGTPIIQCDDHPHYISLDVTHLRPDEAAASILSAIGRLGER